MDENRSQILSRASGYEALVSQDEDITYIYVIEIRTEAGDDFYYVGKTSDLKRRLSEHFRNKEIRTPYDLDYEITALEEVVVLLGDIRDESSIERRMANLVVLEKETMNVIGGF